MAQWKRIHLSITSPMNLSQVLPLYYLYKYLIIFQDQCNSKGDACRVLLHILTCPKTNSSSAKERKKKRAQFIFSKSCTVSLRSSTTKSTSSLVVPLPTLSLKALAATSVGTPQLRRIWEGLADVCIVQYVR